jgi:hypothetical protein
VNSLEPPSTLLQEHGDADGLIAVIYQFVGSPDSGVDIGCIIGLDDHDRTFQHPVALVEAIHCHSRAVYVVNGGRVVWARERIDDPDLDRF